MWSTSPLNETSSRIDLNLIVPDKMSLTAKDLQKALGPLAAAVTALPATVKSAVQSESALWSVFVGVLMIWIISIISVRVLPY